MSLSRAIPLLLLSAISAAAKTTVHISGTTRKSEAQVLELMGGRLEHVRNQDASPSRADDAAFLVKQIMKKDGYAGVQVSWKIVNRNEILLMVKEDIRLEMGKVTLTGVPPDETEKLVKLYTRPAKADHPLASDSAPYRKEDEETGLSYIRQDLNAQGYWDAEAKIAFRSPDPKTGEINPTIEVRKGGLFFIAPVRIVSPDNRAESLTRTTAAPFVGKEATTGNLNGMRAAVEKSFVSSGYPDAKITMARSLEDTRFIPEFHIDLGKRVRLNKIHVDGLKITKPARIEERMKALEGEWYDEAAMNKRVRGFLATGAFSSVRIETTPVSEDRIDATLHLEEGRAREVSFAVGADSYQGPIFRASYADRNLGGTLRGFSSGIELSGRGLLGETKVTDPWFLGSDVAITARLYALSYTRDGYTSLETGLDAKTLWKWGDHFTLEALAGYSIVNLAEDGLDTAFLGETVYTHPRVRVTSTLDFRDSAVLPTKGWHLETPLEIGAAIGDISSAYVSTGISGGWYHKLNAAWQLGVGGEFGIVVPSGDKYDMPIDMRLFNGGARSVRSFPERELGPKSDGYPLGGQAMWNTNTELIRTISGSVKGVLFLDAGTLSQTVGDLPSAQVEVALGLGIRFDLPIGPVRLEYGYNLTRDEDDPSGTFHFAIGMAF